MADETLDLVQQGIELMAAGNYADAEEVLERALESDKKNGRVYYHLGNCRVNLGKTDQAIADFKKAALFEDIAPEANYSLACALFIKGDAPAAIKQFNKCEEAGFASVDMYGIMSVIYMDAGDATQAIRCVNKAIRLEPLNPQPRLDKAQLYITQGMNREAIGVLREMEDLMPDVADTYLTEAELFASMGENDNALSTIERALERFPEDPSLHVAYARVLNSAGRYEDALAAVETARAVAGADAPGASREASLQESVAYAGLGKVADSVAVLEAACAAEPQDADLAYLLMNESYSLERYEQAERAAAHLLAIEGAEARYRAAALFTQAMCEKKLGKLDDAQAAERFSELTRQLRKVTIANPGLMDVYIYRLLSHKELGEYDKAHELAEHLVRVLPESATGYAFHADIAKAEGDAAAVETYREQALQIEPDFKL